MKTNHINTPPAIPHFEGIVIDPETGRKCALQIDIFKGLELAGGQVTACNARVYQSRYYDILDVLEARAKVRTKPQHKGIILGELAGMIAACVVGVALASGVISAVSETTTPILREAVGHQEQIVAMVEDNGVSGAALAREQWDQRKAVSLVRIADLETLNAQ